jgi:DNA polymerase-3 subunit beta
MVVVGTDLDLTIRVDIEVIGLEDGACVAPAKLLSDIVRSLEPGAVTVELAEEKVGITASRSRFSLHTFPLDDFPLLSVPTEPTTVLPARAFLDALRQVVRAASGDDARGVLTGVLLTAENDTLRLVATDSYRLALRDLPGTGKSFEAEQILVPARALVELQRLPGLAAGMKNDVTEDIGLSFGEHDVTFSFGEVRVSTRLLDGNYPPYRQLIPDSFPNALNVGKESLLDALRRVRLLVRDNTTPVRLSMRSGGVDLTVVSQEVGDASETVDADFDGTDLTVAFNPSYLIDGIEAAAGDEIVLETTDAAKPATVRAVEQDDYRYLLMPVRVS